ncbi:MAG: DNA repair protein RecO [Clostridia bacterium]|nr:DNA repair protein RecO [Clostridia bacterium]
MEIKTQALCLKAIDVGESNKLLTLFSAEYGKIVAQIRSIKSPKSKLKACAMPLCFGEYILNKKGNFYTVTGCTVEENFFDSWTSVERYSASQIVLEALDKLNVEGEADPRVLVYAVRILNAINYGEVTPFLYATSFLINQLPSHGVDVDEDQNLPIKAVKIFNAYRNASVEELETLDISLNDVILGLTYANYIYRDRLGERINSLNEALKLLNNLP